jgi:hypothetical protein
MDRNAYAIEPTRSWFPPDIAVVQKIALELVDLHGHAVDQGGVFLNRHAQGGVAAGIYPHLEKSVYESPAHEVVRMGF